MGVELFFEDDAGVSLPAVSKRALFQPEAGDTLIDGVAPPVACRTNSEAACRLRLSEAGRLASISSLSEARAGFAARI